MVEPPSKQLQQVLFGQKLCTERDLRRCRKFVRRLSGDLPAFDSVWLDALVQTQKLTSFQSLLIETGQHDSLRIGPSVVLDRMGGCGSETFLARDAASSSMIVVKRMSVPAELKSETLARLQHLIDTTKGLAHPGLVLAHACSELGPSRSSKRPTDSPNWPGARVDLAVATRLVEGLSLGELLLRRGRFPPNVVTEIARQALEQLALLHDRDLVHGELGLQNLRLQSSGQLMLLDAGMAPALHPELQINAFARPDRYDGVAPELIGTGQVQTAKTDFYALGVVLWQLLAGRPPFTTGDALAKLAAHQMQRVPDVRELAPETPEKLARIVSWLTERDPAKRPLSAKAVLMGTSQDKATTASDLSKTSRSAAGKSMAKAAVTSTLGLPKRSGRIVLSRFAESFRQPPVRRLPRPTNHFPKFVAAAAVVVLLAAGAVIGLHGQTRHWVLAELPRLGLNVSSSAADASLIQDPATPQNEVQKPSAESQLLPLPKPDPRGVIELDGAGPYRAEKIIWRGHQLVLRGRPDSPAVIRVESQPLWLRATYEIRCEHVRIELASSSPSSHVSASLKQLAVFESQELRMRHCGWYSPLSSQVGGVSDDSQQPLDAFVWGPHNTQDSLKRRLELHDTQIVGTYGTIHISGAGRDHDIVCDNLLKADGGPLLLIEPHRGRQRAVMSVTLNRSTLRACDGVIGLKLRDDQLDAGLALNLNDTLLALRTPTGGRSNQPVIALIGDRRLASGWGEHVSLTSTGSVTLPGLMRFALASTDGTRIKALDATAPKTSGLISADFTFRGDDVSVLEHSLIDDFVAPRRSATLPGIQLGETP